MKKLFTLTLLLASLVFTATFTQAQSRQIEQRNNISYQQTRRIQQNTRYNRRGVRVVTRTRIVKVGRQRYRETIQIKYLPNGRTQIRVLNRVRIR